MLLRATCPPDNPDHTRAKRIEHFVLNSADAGTIDPPGRDTVYARYPLRPYSGVRTSVYKNLLSPQTSLTPLALSPPLTPSFSTPNYAIHNTPIEFITLTDAERRKLVNAHKRMARIYEGPKYFSRYDSTAEREQDVPLDRAGLAPGKPLQRTNRVRTNGRWNA